MVCDLTIAADNAIFGQTGPKVLSSVTSFTRVLKNNVFISILVNEHIFQVPVEHVFRYCYGIK